MRWAADGVTTVRFTPDVDDSDPDRLDVCVRLLRIAMAEVLPPGTRPPEYLR